nr:hypothetical protein [Vibrio ouci]
MATALKPFERLFAVFNSTAIYCGHSSKRVFGLVDSGGCVTRVTMDMVEP